MLHQYISQGVGLRTVVVNIKLHAVHLPLPTDLPDITLSFHQIDPIAVAAFDQQIVFRFIRDGERLVEVKRDGVGAGLP